MPVSQLNLTNDSTPHQPPGGCRGPTVCCTDVLKASNNNPRLGARPPLHGRGNRGTGRLCPCQEAPGSAAPLCPCDIQGRGGGAAGPPALNRRLRGQGGGREGGRPGERCSASAGSLCLSVPGIVCGERLPLSSGWRRAGVGGAGAAAPGSPAGGASGTWPRGRPHDLGRGGGSAGLVPARMGHLEPVPATAALRRQVLPGLSAHAAVASRPVHGGAPRCPRPPAPSAGPAPGSHVAAFHARDTLEGCWPAAAVQCPSGCFCFCFCACCQHRMVMPMVVTLWW